MDLEASALGSSGTGNGKDLQRSVIRGSLSLTSAGLLTQAINYATHIGLGRFLTPAYYGYFGILASTFSLLQVILRWGLSRAVSFYIARDRDAAYEILKKSLGLQTAYALVCFLLFFSLAERLAVLLGDPGLTVYLRPTAFFILTFAFVPVYSGFLNGIGTFSKVGVVGVVRSLVQLLLVLILLAAGMEIYGVIVAYTLSPLVAIAYAIWAARSVPGAAKKQVRAMDIITFGFPLFISALAVSLLMRIDLFMVQSLLRDRVLTGLYTAASTLIRVPYFLSHGVGQVLFQSVAQLKTKSPSEACEFISRAIHYYLLVLAPIPFILSGTAEAVLRAVYGASYSPAAPAFQILSFCFVFMVLYDILTTFMAALDWPRLSMALNLVSLPVQVFLVYEWISTSGLIGAALATTATWALGTLLGGLYLLHKGYLLLPRWKTYFNLGLASLCSYVVTLWASPTGPWLLLFYPVVYLAYLLFLRFTGEVGNEEIQALLEALLPARSDAQKA